MNLNLIFFLINIIFYSGDYFKYEFDKDGNIWFKFLSIVKILEYKNKSSRDILRDKVNK